MAVDFSLPALQTPQVQTPEQNAQALALIENSRSMAEQRQAQADLRQQQAAEAARVAGTRSAWQAAMQASQGDPDAAATALDKVNPDAAAYGRAQTDLARTNALKQANATVEARSKQVAFGASLLQSIDPTDPNDYANKVQAIRGLAGNDPQVSQFMQTTLPLPGEPGYDPSKIQNYVNSAQAASIPHEAYWQQMQKSVDAANDWKHVESLVYDLAAHKNESPQDLLKEIASHRLMGLSAANAQPYVDAITSGAYKTDPLFFEKMGGLTKPEQAAAMTGTIPGTTTPTEAAKSKAFEDQTARLAATRPIDVGMGGTLMSPTGQVLGTSVGGTGPGGGPMGLPGAEPAGTRHPEVLANLPTGQAEIAKQIGDYQYPLPSGMAQRTPYWQNLIEMATRYNPNLDISQYAIRQAARKAFTTGTEGQAVNSINTVVGHLDKLDQDATALSNSTLTPWNSLRNYLSAKTGHPEVTNFNTDADAVASELTKAFRGSGGAEADIQNWRNNLSASESPEQLKESIQKIVGLMGSRLDALKSQYEKSIGEPANFQFLNPKAASVLQRIAPGVIDTSGVTGGQATTAVPPQVLAAGPGRHTFKNGQVWDVSADGKSATRVK